jgi:fatty acid desaturase
MFLFSGHLNYQIEHHLFPQMPRHNYPLVAGEVQAFLKKHNIEYRSRGFFQAAGDVMVALDDASKTYSAMKSQKKAGRERSTTAPVTTSTF